MRIATFNILHGRSLSDGQVDLDRLADAVRSLDADVLALQEVDRDQPRSHGADLTHVAAEAMGADEHRFVATMSGLPDVWTAATGDEQPESSAYGVSLLSRFPVSSWKVLALPSPQQRVPVTFPDRKRPVLVKDEARTALAARVDTPEGQVTVVGTHLTFIPGWNVAQLRHIMRATRGMPRPFLLMGDLNMAGGEPSRHSGLRPLVTATTFPLTEPTEQLDHILVDGEVRTTEPGHSRNLGMSDHRALSVGVSLGRTAVPQETDGGKVASPSDGAVPATQQPARQQPSTEDAASEEAAVAEAARERPTREQATTEAARRR
ncbi:endonuclease/exonuclease/phosphatase family protein [Georgenia halophila]|uniref:Endonuclease/exonuclease/phosphatase family protein n=1 Tax=Georgenia halophila TaxID=620889 RepID=A0ABP8LI35_9MICO